MIGIVQRLFGDIFIPYMERYVGLNEVSQKIMCNERRKHPAGRAFIGLHPRPAKPLGGPLAGARVPIFFGPPNDSSVGLKTPP